jgi:hypothetical protein
MSATVQTSIRRTHSSHRRGAVLVEFAIVSFVLLLLFSAILSFGIILFKANVVQQAADVAAQELARTPLNPTGYTLDQVLFEYVDPNDTANPLSAVRSQLFDEQYLVAQVNSGQSLSDFMSNKPLINRLLMPLMFRDTSLELLLEQSQQLSSQIHIYRYPGAVVKNESHDYLTVLVPRVTLRNTYGIETIDWHRVIEDATITSQNSPGVFDITVGGMVNLRINCPVQTPMIGFQPASTGPFDPNWQNVVQASDASVQEEDPLGLMTSYSLVVPAGAPATTAGVVSNMTDTGRFGLGSFYSPLPRLQQSDNALVRPFRKLVVAQGVYRREVFGP